jgi:hypothetical protein
MVPLLTPLDPVHALGCDQAYRVDLILCLTCYCRARHLPLTHSSSLHFWRPMLLQPMERIIKAGNRGVLPVVQ